MLQARGYATRRFPGTQLAQTTKSCAPLANLAYALDGGKVGHFLYLLHHKIVPM